MKTKVCTKCNLLKPLTEFYKNKRYADGHVTWCKDCKKKHARENPGPGQNWIKNNPERSKEIKDDYVDKNLAKVKASKSKWSKTNPKKELAKVRRYQAAKLNATPDWLTKEQIIEMQNIYINCPKEYHVDHIVPLRGRNVRGLHVPWNLQYLPAKVNSRKSNKY